MLFTSIDYYSIMLIEWHSCILWGISESTKASYITESWLQIKLFDRSYNFNATLMCRYRKTIGKSISTQSWYSRSFYHQVKTLKFHRPCHLIINSCCRINSEPIHIHRGNLYSFARYSICRVSKWVYFKYKSTLFWLSLKAFEYKHITSFEILTFNWIRKVLNSNAFRCFAEVA